MTTLELAFKEEVENFLDNQGVTFPEDLVKTIVDKLINECDPMWDTINSYIRETIIKEFEQFM